MEKKSLGTFLAALRRSSGMTQRELAEKLNVSDKAVSRWERDEASPDITLIPVIAEIFNVTADELLRGERLTAERAEFPPANFAVKVEKQIQRLIDSSLSRFSSRLLIIYGMLTAGLAAAALCNLALLKGLLGLCIAELVFIVTAFCLVFFSKNAFAAVKSDEFDGELRIQYRKSVFNRTTIAAYAIALSIAFCLPLSMVNAFQGLNAFTWFNCGMICLEICTVLFFAGWLVFKAAARKKGLLPPRPTVEKSPERTKKIKRLTAVILAVLVPVLLLEGTLQVYFSSYENFGRGRTFYDTVHFVRYMEDYTQSDRWTATDSTNHEDTEYNYIYTETVYDSYGVILCSFNYRGECPAYSVGKVVDGSPITVFTYVLSPNQRKLLNTVMYAVYIAELFTAAAVYMKKRVE